MKVPIQRAEIPVAVNYDAARDKLDDVLGGDLPLFALHNAGVTTDEMVENLGPVFERYDYTLSVMDLNLVESAVGYKKPEKVDGRPANVRYMRRAEGLHTDGRPNLVKPMTTAVNGHLTDMGHGRGQFLEVSQIFALSGRFNLPKGTNKLLDEGYVDTDVLNPLLYEVELGVGSLVIFRTVGRLPVAHRFFGLKLPRSSLIIQAFDKASAFSPNPLGPK